jgi:hypothetical protein
VGVRVRGYGVWKLEAMMGAAFVVCAVAFYLLGPVDVFGGLVAAGECDAISSAAGGAVASSTECHRGKKLQTISVTILGILLLDCSAAFVIVPSLLDMLR